MHPSTWASAMNRCDFLERLVELCKTANVSLAASDQYDGSEQFCGTDWSFVSNEKDATGLWWNIEINDELKRLIGTQGDR